MLPATHSPATCFQVCSKYARLGEVPSAASCSLASPASCSERMFLKPFTRGHLMGSAWSTRGALLYTSEKVSKRGSRSTFSSIVSAHEIGTWGLLISGRTGHGGGTTRSESASTSERGGGRQEPTLRSQHSAILTDWAATADCVFDAIF